MQTIIITALVTAILCTISFVSWGQTFSEWFRQKKTKIKYLKKQIAALEAFKAVAEAGYGQAEEGVDTAGGIEKWILEMDKDWQQALTRVKPSLRESEEIRMAFFMGNAMSSVVEISLEEYARCPWLGASEFVQVKFGFELVKDDTEMSLRELLLLITDGAMEMDDNERLERIDEITKRIRLAGQFVKMCILQTDELTATRAQQAANDEYLKKNLR